MAPRLDVLIDDLWCHAYQGGLGSAGNIEDVCRRAIEALVPIANRVTLSGQPEFDWYLKPPRVLSIEQPATGPIRIITEG
jgi:hypothetical protein